MSVECLQGHCISATNHLPSLVPRPSLLLFFCNNNFVGRKERTNSFFPASKIVTSKESEREGLGMRLPSTSISGSNYVLEYLLLSNVLLPSDDSLRC